MKVEFRGTLSDEVKLADVLYRIIERAEDGFSSLHMTAKQLNRQADIFILDGQFVTGASLSDIETSNEVSGGYDALREICRLENADYSYMIDLGDLFDESIMCLQIELGLLVQILPNLPTDQKQIASVAATVPKVESAEAAAAPRKSRLKPASNLAAQAAMLTQDAPEGRAAVPEEPKFASLEQRAAFEIGDKAFVKRPKRLPLPLRLVAALFRSIKFFFMNIFTAAEHVLKKGSLLILIILIIALVFGGTKLMGAMQQAHTATHKIKGHSR